METLSLTNSIFNEEIPQRQHHLAPLRIILLEDNKFDAEIILRALRQSGMEVDHRVVASQESFLTELAAFSPDVVLADYRLPSFDGLSALKLLQELSPDIPFILISGNIGEEIAVEALHQGATDYIIKDRLTRLPASITRALQEAESNRERRRMMDALNQSETLWKTAFDASNDIMLLLNHERIILAANQRAVNAYGYGENELLSMRIEQLRKYPNASYSESSTGTVYETEHVRKDGSVFQVEVSTKVFSVNGIKQHSIYAIRDISDRKRREREIEQLHTERVSMLLREIHHRVKNNLQIISSLLNLQSGYITDPATLEMFKESQDRVRSMAMIHEMLYRSKELSRINFGEYIRTLANSLFNSYRDLSRGARLKIEAQEVNLDIDTAIPFGLILNELISNSFKHAFQFSSRGTDTQPGVISIVLTVQQSHELTLTIQDNGPGIPETIDLETTQTLGLRLVRTLVRQLGASINLSSDGGTTWTISHTLNGIS